MARMSRLQHLIRERDAWESRCEKYRADFEAAAEKLVTLRAEVIDLRSANEKLSREVMSLRGELIEERRKTDRAIADRNEVSWLLVLNHWKNGK